MKRTKQKIPDESPPVVQTGRTRTNRFSFLEEYNPLSPCQMRFYAALREAVPVIDAAILKIIRLIGGYRVLCPDREAQSVLAEFLQTVKVGAVSIGLESFLCGYLDSLLMYGNAVGEIVLDQAGTRIMGLYNGDLEDIALKPGKTPLQADIYIRAGEKMKRVKNRDLILFTALNPQPAAISGNSILRGLPFVSSILLKIYESIGSNFERIGNLRYAVTYKPAGETDRGFAKERAQQIAKTWSEGMTATKNGNVTDFVSVGDVQIRVIGADNQMIDTEIPVRQMLEQIVAKLSIPPFLLGLAWSTTERMSKQQSDILTSELEYYRRLLTPLILKISRIFLRLQGYTCDPEVSWDFINLQDETEIARAELLRAQAKQIQSGSEKNNAV